MKLSTEPQALLVYARILFGVVIMVLFAVAFLRQWITPREFGEILLYLMTGMRIVEAGISVAVAKRNGFTKSE